MTKTVAQAFALSPASVAEYEAGAGPPLVLLHPLAGSWRIWRPVASRLERHHRVVAPTMPGHLHGEPWDVATRLSVVAMTDVIEAWMDRRELDRPHLAGNSLGGWVSLELARRGRASSVTALSPAGSWDPVAGIDRLVRMARFGHAAINVMGPNYARLVSRPLLRRALLRVTMEHGERMPTSAAADFMSDAAGCTIFDELAVALLRDGPIRAPVDVGGTPVRILWGQHDRILPVEPYGRLMAAAVPAAQMEVVPGVGHVPMYDDPGLVAGKILATTGVLAG